MIEFIGQHSEAIVALCAFFIASYQAFLMRQHNKLSVRPLLVDMDYEEKTDTEYILRFEVSNKGLGPAIIEEFVFYLSGAVCEANAALKSALDGLEYRPGVTKLGPGHALMPGDKIAVIIVRFSPNDLATLHTFQARLNKLDLKIRYRSSYNEQFTYKSSGVGG